MRAAPRKAVLAGAYEHAAQLTCRAEALQEQIDAFKQALRQCRADQQTSHSKPDRNVSATAGAKSTSAATLRQPALAGAPA